MLPTTLTVSLIKWIVDNPEKMREIASTISNFLSGSFRRVQDFFSGNSTHEDYLRNLREYIQEIILFTEAVEQELAQLPAPIREILMRLRNVNNKSSEQFPRQNFTDILQDVDYLLRFLQDLVSEANKNRASQAVTNVLGRIQDGEKGTPING